MADWVRKLAEAAKRQQTDRQRQELVITEKAPALWEQLVMVLRSCLETFNSAFQGDAEREVRWIQPSRNLLYVVKKYRPDPMPSSIAFDLARGRVEARVEMDAQVTRHFILPEPEVLESIQMVADGHQNLYLEHAGRQVDLEQASEILLRPLLFRAASGEAGAAGAR